MVWLQVALSGGIRFEKQLNTVAFSGASPSPFDRFWNMRASSKPRVKIRKKRVLPLKKALYEFHSASLQISVARIVITFVIELKIK